MIGSLVLFFGATVLLVATIKKWLAHKSKTNFWTTNGVEFVPNQGVIMRILTGHLNTAESDIKVYTELKQKGKLYGGIIELGHPILVVRDLDMMREVFIKSFDHFTDAFALDLKESDPHMHHALFNMHGEQWKDMRTALSPAFTTGRIRRMFHIFDKSAKKMNKSVASQVMKCAILDIRPLVLKVTLDIIASTAFGIDTNLFEDPNSILMKMGLKWQASLAGTNFVKIILLNLAPGIAKLLKLRLTDEESDMFLTRMIKDCLDYRQKTGKMRDDFLQLMLEARAGQLEYDGIAVFDDNHSQTLGKSKVEFTDEVIIAQALLFILGGFDTSEILLNCALYEIAVNPEVQEHILEEIRSALRKGDGDLTYDTVNALDYLGMVVAETLRKYPAVIRLQRLCTRPYKLPDSNFIVPKNMLLIFPAHAVQHDEDIWPEPEKFDPLRFTKENMAKRHPMAYLPFGQGPRHCIGNRFALMETKVVIANLVLNYQLEPCEKTTIPLKLSKSSLPLKPDGSIWIRVRPRH